MSKTEIRTLVHDAVTRLGARKTSRILGNSVEATLRLAGNFPVQEGTVALAEKHAPQLRAALDCRDSGTGTPTAA